MSSEFMGPVEVSVPPRTGVARLAPIVAAPAAVLAVVGLVLSLQTDVAVAIGGHVYEDVILAIVWSSLASLILHRMPRHPIGWLFILVGASHGLAVAAGQFALAAGVNGWPGRLIAGWVSQWAWAPGMLLPLTVLLLLFPDGRVASPRWKFALWIGISGVIGVSASLALDPRIALGPAESAENPIGVLGADVGFVVFIMVVVFTGIASITSLILRLRASNGDTRRQLAPVAVASAIAILALTAAPILPSWAPVIQLVALPLLPLSAALALLRYRLYNLEIIVRRSVIWGGLTILVVAGYALVVQGLSALLRSEDAVAESLLAAGAVALAFQPARIALQTLANRSLYGERDTPITAITNIGERMAGASDPDAALHIAAEGLRDALRVPWVGVYDSSDAGLVASSGSAPAWSANAISTRELLHLGSPRGQLAVCRRSPRETLNGADERLISAFLAPLAATLASRHYVSDLRESNERLVLAREEERHRLRRDIHDGLGPMLAAVATQADIAILRQERTGEMGDILEQVRTTATDAMGDVRRIIENLRPPSLTELGLIGAIKEFCDARSSPESALISVDGTLPRLASAVEVAMYRIAIEAVTNSLRHAGAAHVRVSFAAADGGVIVTVTDDGRGWDVGATTTGIGVPNMRERCEELGGALSIVSGADGTVVRATLWASAGGT
ncbi:sensor histidine kinase [Glaciibacter superstes]|uniref:sensor histidine kinase n=1 Tax=Glaciibacter superstes TaxID=501023 RepID=UPI000A030903|nr:sensor histidine kinase [Glaciibacter superstes]